MMMSMIIIIMTDYFELLVCVDAKITLYVISIIMVGNNPNDDWIFLGCLSWLAKPKNPLAFPTSLLIIRRQSAVWWIWNDNICSIVQMHLLSS